MKIPRVVCLLASCCPLMVAAVPPSPCSMTLTSFMNYSLPATTPTVGSKLNSVTGYLTTDYGVVTLACPPTMLITNPVDGTAGPALNIKCTNQKKLVYLNGVSVKYIFGCAYPNETMCAKSYPKYDDLLMTVPDNKSATLWTENTNNGEYVTVGSLQSVVSSLSCKHNELQPWTSDGSQETAIVNCSNFGVGNPTLPWKVPNLPLCYPAFVGNFSGVPTCTVEMTYDSSSVVMTVPPSVTPSAVNVSGHTVEIVGGTVVNVSCIDSSSIIQLTRGNGAVLLTTNSATYLQCFESSGENAQTWSPYLEEFLITNEDITIDCVLPITSSFPCSMTLKSFMNYTLPATTTTVNSTLNNVTGYLTSNYGLVTLICPDSMLVTNPVDGIAGPNVSITCNANHQFEYLNGVSVKYIFGCTYSNETMCAKSYPKYDDLLMTVPDNKSATLWTEDTDNGEYVTVGSLQSIISTLSCTNSTLQLWTSAGQKATENVNCSNYGLGNANLPYNITNLPLCYPEVPTCTVQLSYNSSSVVMTLPAASPSVMAINGNAHQTIGGTSALVSCVNPSYVIQLTRGDGAVLLTIYPTTYLSCYEPSNSKAQIWSPYLGTWLSNNESVTVDCVLPPTTSTTSTTTTTTAAATTTTAAASTTTATTTTTTSSTTISVPTSSTASAVTNSIAPTATTLTTTTQPQRI